MRSKPLTSMWPNYTRHTAQCTLFRDARWAHLDAILDAVDVIDVAVDLGRQAPGARRDNAAWTLGYVSLRVKNAGTPENKARYVDLAKGHFSSSPFCATLRSITVPSHVRPPLSLADKLLHSRGEVESGTVGEYFVTLCCVKCSACQCVFETLSALWGLKTQGGRGERRFEMRWHGPAPRDEAGGSTRHEGDEVRHCSTPFRFYTPFRTRTMRSLSSWRPPHTFVQWWTRDVDS